jgi:hypothetical protein
MHCTATYKSSGKNLCQKSNLFCVLNRTGAGRAVTHIINRSVQNYWFRNNVWWSWTRGGAEAPGAFTKDVEEYNQSEYCRLAGDVFGLVLSTSGRRKSSRHSQNGPEKTGSTIPHAPVPASVK